MPEQWREIIFVKQDLWTCNRARSACERPTIYEVRNRIPYFSNARMQIRYKQCLVLFLWNPQPIEVCLHTLYIYIYRECVYSHQCTIVIIIIVRLRLWAGPLFHHLFSMVLGGPAVCFLYVVFQLLCTDGFQPKSGPRWKDTKCSITWGTWEHDFVDLDLRSLLTMKSCWCSPCLVSWQVGPNSPRHSATV